MVPPGSVCVKGIPHRVPQEEGGEEESSSGRTTEEDQGRAEESQGRGKLAAIVNYTWKKKFCVYLRARRCSGSLQALSTCSESIHR